MEFFRNERQQVKQHENAGDRVKKRVRRCAVDDGHKIRIAVRLKKRGEERGCEQEIFVPNPAAARDREREQKKQGGVRHCFENGRRQINGLDGRGEMPQQLGHFVEILEHRPMAEKPVRVVLFFVRRERVEGERVGQNLFHIVCRDDVLGHVAVESHLFILKKRKAEVGGQKADQGSF